MSRGPSTGTRAALAAFAVVAAGIFMARTPGPANENYGYANWYLNHTNTEGRNAGSKPLPNAPEGAVKA